MTFSQVHTVQYHWPTLNLLLNSYKITTKRIILFYFGNFFAINHFLSTFTYPIAITRSKWWYWSKIQICNKYWNKIFRFITIKCIKFLMSFTCLEHTSFFKKLYDWYFPSFPHINLKWCKRTRFLRKMCIAKLLWTVWLL